MRRCAVVAVFLAAAGAALRSDDDPFSEASIGLLRGIPIQLVTMYLQPGRRYWNVTISTEGTRCAYLNGVSVHVYEPDAPPKAQVKLLSKRLLQVVRHNYTSDSALVYTTLYCAPDQRMQLPSMRRGGGLYNDIDVRSSNGANRRARVRQIVVWKRHMLPGIGSIWNRDSRRYTDEDDQSMDYKLDHAGDRAGALHVVKLDKDVSQVDLMPGQRRF